MLIVAYQERKQDEVTHPLLGQKGALGVMPHLQARLLARILRGDGGRLHAVPESLTVLVIVCYDVSTETRDGRRRLRAGRQSL